MTADAATRVSANRRFPALEGIRGLAAHIVVLSHMSRAGLSASHGLDLKGLGQYAVLLFFVLSAFLLTKQYLDRPPAPRGARGYWAAYAIRRVLRIYPLYALALLWAALSPVAAYALAGREPLSIVRHLLLLDGQKIFWTIPVEMKFYFVLPFLLVIARWICGTPPIRTAGFALAVVAVLCVILPVPAFVGHSISLQDYYIHFLLGVAGAAWWKSVEDKPRSRAAGVAWDVVGLVMLPAILAPWAIGNIFKFTHVWTRQVFGSDGPWFGPAWTLVILSTLAGTGVMRRLFELPFLRWAGVAAFSSYVLHMPVIQYLRLTPLRDSLGRDAEWFLTWFATFVVAGLSFRLVEKPFIDLAMRWSARLVHRKEGEEDRAALVGSV